MGTIAAAIKEKLIKNLIPSYIEVIDESDRHAGHAGAAAHKAGGGSAESHFRVVIVSDTFAGKSRLERHRLVMDILADEIPKIHAFSLQASTPEDAGKL